jgi:putative transposase
LQAVKAVRQNYRPTEEILSLLEDFRCMVNDCVRIGLKENLTSMKSLSLSAYHQLSAIPRSKGRVGAKQDVARTWDAG